MKSETESGARGPGGGESRLGSPAGRGRPTCLLAQFCSSVESFTSYELRMAVMSSSSRALDSCSVVGPQPGQARLVLPERARAGGQKGALYHRFPSRLSGSLLCPTIQESQLSPRNRIKMISRHWGDSWLGKTLLNL